MTVGCPAAGQLPVQGPVAASQPPNRRLAPIWPGMPMQSHMASTQAASEAEAKMQVFAGGSLQAGGARSPIIVPTSVRKFHQAGTQAGTPSALVHPKACLRACADWMRAPAACCTGIAAERRVWHAPKRSVGSLVSFSCSAHSVLARAAKNISLPPSACPLALRQGAVNSRLRRPAPETCAAPASSSRPAACRHTVGRLRTLAPAFAV